MATARALSMQRERATNDLLAAASLLADSLGIAAPVLPTHKDTMVMEIRRLETLAAFLATAAEAFSDAKAADKPVAGAVGSITTETVAYSPAELSKTAPAGKGRK